MLPEQQQRILGYFIEEARDHLNTIEQGLLNLESTLNDPEMINEVFRAAHSIKGGAAMLGLSSIQHTSHRLEDCFKVLKEHPVQIDQKLESLFLGVSDTLKVLLENLSGPYGLSEETANTLMSETEPVFQWLHEHLELLVKQGTNGVVSSTREIHSQSTGTDNVNSLSQIFQVEDTNLVFDTSEEERSPVPIPEDKNWGEFQTQVLQTLREMLQLFKQSTTPESRQNLEQCCHQLVTLGEKFHLPKWCSLCQAAASAIANPENTYLTLAKIVITEFKQAQELVLQGRDIEITISQQLEALLNFPEIELLEITPDLLEQEPATQSITETGADHLLSGTTDDFVNGNKNTIISLTEVSEQLNLDVEIPAAAENTVTETSLLSHPLSSLENDRHPTNTNIDSKGPEVGIAELNTLAGLFEIDNSELDETWQQEEILDVNTDNTSGIIDNSETENLDNDFADFLLFDDDNSSEEIPTISANSEDLSLLFGDNFLEKDNSELPVNVLSDTTFELDELDNISDLELNLDSSNEPIFAELTQIADDSQKSAGEMSTANISDDLLELGLDELTQIADDSQKSAGEISTANISDDLVELELDENESISPGELTPAETENIASLEVTTKQENNFEELFLADKNTNRLEESTPNNHISQPENVSFDHLFAELEENSLLSPSESAIGDLFNTSDDTNIEFSVSEDPISNFWEQEAEPEQKQEVVQALEESLFMAAANEDFFVDSQQDISSPTNSFGVEDFELTFLQPEPELELNITSDVGNDLFGEFTASNTTNLSAVRDDVESVAESIHLQSENDSTDLTPEVLDFIPEFTNQPLETEFADSSKSFTDLEFEFLDASDENEDQTITLTTYIQLDSADNPINDLDDLLPRETINPEFNFTDIAIESEILDSPLATEVKFTEASLVQSEELGLDNDLLMRDYALLAGESQEELLQSIGTESELNLTAESADLSEPVLDIGEISQVENGVIIPQAVAPENQTYIQDEFADLEALLQEEQVAPIRNAFAITVEDFAALEALLGTDNNEQVSSPPLSFQPQLTPAADYTASKAVIPEIDDEFSDLEKLLAQADQTISHSPQIKSNTNKIQRSSNRRAARFEETMKVPVKQLDDMSNLVGELVVNRNTLEQDHERLRQSLDNLLIQVQQLSNVGARMQELYERSLLEASLLASRKHKDSASVPTHDSNAERGFSELEMDRFTPFHTLSQEMIEMIVRVRESASDIDFVTEETERVARQFRQVTTQLQEGLTRARMVPFSQTIDRLRRGVRDNAIKYGKQVELLIEGGNTLIDKMILDHLNDPLTHMLNNAIIHGIETSEERATLGKSPVGVITIRAFHQGNQTVISVGDDGAGIDAERVKAKALKLGMITAQQAKAMSRIDVYDLLFQSGFTMKDQADEMSGRGVGMDVVRSEISEIRGIVNTDSAIGKGTTFTIRLPLTLSICKALCCVSDRARIAFPMDGVEDTLDIPVKNIQHTADGQSFISWRDTILPFRPLKELLSFNRQLSRGNVYGGNRDDDMVSVVVVRSGNTLIALQIDLVLSEQEIVIKQFESPAPKPIGVAGATVLGDGRIMPIADVLEIMDIFQGRISKQNTSTYWQQKATPNTPDTSAVKIDPTVLIVDDSITVRELLSLTFNKAGYRVEQARDGQEAWDKLRSGLPCDIVFCDIEMPRCDGLELLSRIQKDNNLNHLPIAMLTSRGADKHRQMAIQLGASGYFTKPYLEEALLEAAGRMLKGEKLVNTTIV
ncbi:MAG: response regulator [Gloeotrichia echinulata IR180]|jgi:chemotaxis protein histidine kinase CheA/ActR/RegA family two-component response regulator|nr:response regulator [Gloeotrichia echinulata DEX184]